MAISIASEAAIASTRSGLTCGKWDVRADKILPSWSLATVAAVTLDWEWGGSQPFVIATSPVFETKVSLKPQKEEVMVVHREWKVGIWFLWMMEFLARHKFSITIEAKISGSENLD
ncbi:hypothetical protein TorRG33x02_253560 [Trema orientale]|uniref:Uncharacterized protein n=1 Tax=Trema orientale TaxID=63057 RepID=A0A2P5DEP9_TREOI|nr:hypothetical protein TorRG33x02_253560 [Trema orientale]